MGKAHHPRRGSLGYLPKCRAKRIYPRIHSRAESDEIKLTEFAGYKVGMTHANVTNLRKGSTTHGQDISIPVTVIECPPIKVIGIRSYSKKTGGIEVSADLWTDKLDKNCKIKIKKKTNIKDIQKNLDKITNIRLIIQTMPNKTGIGKKKSEILEIEVSGNNNEEKLKFAEEKLGNEMKISEIFKDGDYVDSLGVTKGKGLQGAVKRFGVKRLAAKSQKHRRKPGNLGPFHPHKTSWTIAQPGQLGYFNRVELNKKIVKIGSEPENINVDGGWLHYGNVKNDYILVKGSVQGPSKRLIIIRTAVRDKKDKDEYTFLDVSLESKQ
ncbi:MAG: 50S ribosomal protein L3 [DPANN group archaeon]|nr:50S ribosomal protein L3 [DPANN group archaeon]